MTEDEAKMKWCPFTRVAMAAGPAGDVDCLNNREDMQPGRDSKCLASACMAWRWEPEISGYSQTIRQGETPSALTPMYTGLLSKTDGRCGLAGGPNG